MGGCRREGGGGRWEKESKGGRKRKKGEWREGRGGRKNKGRREFCVSLSVCLCVWEGGNIEIRGVTHSIGLSESSEEW